MIGGARILAKRLSGLNVHDDDRRSSDPGSGTVVTSQSSGKSASKRTKRRQSESYSFNGGGDDESSHHDQELIYLLAVNRANAKRESFRGGLPQSLLQTHDNRDCVAPILLEEINFGPKLGAGEFSNVYEIESFNLQHSDYLDDTKSVQELEKRRLLKQYEKYRETKKARYALKHLKAEYFREHDADKCIQAVG
jgi:hypothetical protein